MRGPQYGAHSPGTHRVTHRTLNLHSTLLNSHSTCTQLTLSSHSSYFHTLHPTHFEPLCLESVDTNTHLMQRTLHPCVSCLTAPCDVKSAPARPDQILRVHHLIQRTLNPCVLGLITPWRATCVRPDQVLRVDHLVQRQPQRWRAHAVPVTRDSWTVPAMSSNVFGTLVPSCHSKTSPSQKTYGS